MTSTDTTASTAGQLSATKRELLDKWRRGQRTADHIPTAEPGTAVPLSFTQQRLWFLTQLQPDNPFYNMTATVTIAGPLNVAAFEGALQAVMDRHDILRAAITVRDGKPHQTVAASVSSPLTVAHAGDDAEELVRDAHRPFAMDTAPLARFVLVPLAEHEWQFTVVMHHIIGDGVSMSVFFRDLIALYTARIEDRSAELPLLDVQFPDYARWQQEQLTGDALSDQISYWRQRLAGAEQLRLPTDHIRPPEPSHRGLSHRFTIPAAAAEHLRSLARAHHATLYMTLLAAFTTLLARYSGQRDIVVGSPVAGRNRPEIEQLIGFFANTLVLRTQLSPDADFATLLDTVRAGCLDAMAHQDVPFDTLVAELRPDRDSSVNPLFQVAFAMQRPPADLHAPDGLRITAADTQAGTARFDLELHCWENDKTIDAVVIGNADLFTAATIERLAGHFVTLLHAIVEDDSRPLHELPLMTGPELLNAITAPTPAPVDTRLGSLTDLLAAAAHATPDAAAVTGPSAGLTYGELQQHSDTIAAALTRRGITPGARVGIAAGDSWQRVAAVVGVLRAGAACVPLSRGAATATPANVAIVLHASDSDMPAGMLDTHAVSVEQCLTEDTPQTTRKATVPAAGPAWISPDGTVLDHHTLVTRIQWLQHQLPLNPSDRVSIPQLLADAATPLALLWPLTVGACVQTSPASQPTVTWQRPTQLIDLPSTLRLLLYTGDLASQDVINDAARRSSAAIWFLHVTSAGGGSIAIDQCVPDRLGDFAPLGPTTDRPLAVVDEYGSLLPTGIPGRVAVLSDSPGSAVSARPRVTDTLERGRRRDDGRIDLLPPHRGLMRWAGQPLDTAHVEAYLRTDPRIADCTVLARQAHPGHHELVAYIVPAAARPATWMIELQDDLPPNWQPITLLPISRVPLTPDGRPDDDALRALPAADAAVAAVCEQQLRALPGCQDAAALLGPVTPTVDQISLDDPAAPGQQPVTPESQHPTLHRRDMPLAYAEGPTFPGFGTVSNLGDLLLRAAADHPDHGVSFHGTDGETFQSYPQLLDAAARVLAGLRARGVQPGDEAVLQFSIAADFLPAFWACILGGVVPVPLAVPASYERDDAAALKLDNAWTLLARPWLLTTASVADAAAARAERNAWPHYRAAALEDLRAHDPDDHWHPSRLEDLALLLLTSGSTGQPKAVMLRHANILGRCVGTSAANGFTADDISFNWMPLDHVGGIVMFHLRDVYLGCRQIQSPTHWILEQPTRWLDMIDHHRATITWSPNFAFGLVNDAIESGRADWDLSCLRFILNGGEAIVPRTARRFLRLLAPSRLPATAMHPAWGMSETSSAATYSDRFQLATTSDNDEFTEVGAPLPGCRIRIVGEHDTVLREGDVGRLQISGPAVTSGYYRNDEQNRASFTDDGWFDTGDLALLRDGRLTITGRAKDVIIINGLNYASHDIEAAVEELACAETSYTAACAVRDHNSDEQLAVFFHPADGFDLNDAARAIRAHLGSRIGVNPAFIVALGQDEIPKTEIGKIQRAKLRAAFENGSLRDDAIIGNAPPPDETRVPHWFHRVHWTPRHPTSPVPGRHYLVTGQGSGLDVHLADALQGQKVSADLGAPTPSLLAHTDVVVSTALYDNPSTDVDDLSSQFLQLVDELAAANPGKRDVELITATRRAQHVIDDESVTAQQNAVTGLIHTAAAELPWLRCRVVDLPGDDATSDGHALAGECVTDHQDSRVAYRTNMRYVARLEAIPAPQLTTGSVPLSTGGTYLVTGGLGGAGRHLCRYLVSHWQARLLIVGRTATDTANDFLQELAELGAQAEYITADITDELTLHRGVHDALSRWGTGLHGVFHLAGVFDEQPLPQITPQTLQHITAAKTIGTQALHRLAAGYPGALFVSFSSVNGFFGGAGVGAYAAASAYLDGIVHQQRRDGVRAYSIAWTMWDETGMSAGYELKQLSRARGFHILTPQQALRSLPAALRQEHGHVLIGLDSGNANLRPQMLTPAEALTALTGYYAGTGQPSTVTTTDRYGTTVYCPVLLVDDIPRLADGSIDRDSLQASTGTGARLSNQPANRRQEDLLGVWADVLSRTDIGIHDSFFDLGGASLAAAQLIFRIRDRLGVEVSLQQLFAAPTIAGMAAALDESQPPDVAIDLRAEAMLDADISGGTPPSERQITTPEQVLLTGATTFLGMFLLTELLRRTHATVHCLIDAPDDEQAAQQLRQNLARYRLDPPTERIRPLAGRLGARHLGLDPDVFDRLAGDLDGIYHAGADVNLASSYEQLRPVNVDGLREVLRLAGHGRSKPVHLLSTAATTISRTAAPGLLLERRAVNSDEVLPAGYVRTKWVAEALAAEAGARGIPVSIYRPGRIAGDSRTGASPDDTLFWQIVRACLDLQAIPADSDQHLDLAPVDYVAAALVQLSLQPESVGGIYHLANPEPVPLGAITAMAAEHGHQLREIPYTDWTTELLQRARTDRARTPAIDAVASLFTSTGTDPGRPTLTQLDCTNTSTQLASSSVRCPAVDQRLLRRYFAFLAPSSPALPDQESNS